MRARTRTHARTCARARAHGQVDVTPLRFACLANRVETAQYLIEHAGAEIRADTFPALIKPPEYIDTRFKLLAWAWSCMETRRMFFMVLGAIAGMRGKPDPSKKVRRRKSILNLMAAADERPRRLIAEYLGVVLGTRGRRIERAYNALGSASPWIVMGPGVSPTEMNAFWNYT